LTADRGRGLARKAIDSPADPARADRDLLVTRLGHAAAGVCFATIAIPATVLVARTPVQRVVSAPDPRVTERLATLDRERQALGEQVGTLDAAVQALRDQIGAVGGNVQGVRARLDQTEGRVADVEAGLKRVREPVVRPATRPPLRRVPAPEAERASESASPRPRVWATSSATIGTRFGGGSRPPATRSRPRSAASAVG